MRLWALIYAAAAAVSGFAEEDYCKVDQNDVVEIPVTFQFASPEFQQPWAYRGLLPSVHFRDGRTLGTPEIDRVRDGLLELVFCVSAKFLPRLDEPFDVQIGPRKLQSSVRPIQWRQQDGVTQGRKWTVRRGRLAPARFETEPPPDWVIVRKAQWNVDSKGGPWLELEIYNPGTSPHPGFELTLLAMNRPRRLVAGTEGRIVPVSIRRTIGGNLAAASGTPQFPEQLFPREASFTMTPAGEAIFQTSLGGSGAIAAATSLTAMYRFETQDEADAARKTGSLNTMLNTALPCRIIEVKAPRVYPTILTAGYGPGTAAKCPD
jgi:hypothetical protein